jgi:hypothetical protein
LIRTKEDKEINGEKCWQKKCESMQLNEIVVIERFPLEALQTCTDVKQKREGMGVPQ